MVSDCKDIVAPLRGYRRAPARISLTTREDILNDPRGYPRFHAIAYKACRLMASIKKESAARVCWSTHVA